MRDTEWFYKKGFGVFVHYLESIMNDPQNPSSLGMKTTWDECLLDFDCDHFANQVSETGAGYVFFTIMQCTKYMIAPNETYNRITGYKNGEACPSFDFIEKLYDALHKRGIELMLYFTGDGPQRDPIAGDAFGYHGYHPDQTKVTRDFVEKWASVLEEYSLHYGNKIKGWWLDGTPGIIGYDDLELLKILTDAARAGNPDAIVACNYYGVLDDNDLVRKQVMPGTPYCDYAAGEMVYFDDIPVGPFMLGTRWHILCHLGKSLDQWEYNGWGKPGCRYSPEYMKAYYRKVHEHGGVISVDICVHRDGTINKDQLEVLKAMKK